MDDHACNNCERLRDELADHENSLKHALDGHSDEEHCSCCPLLRVEVGRKDALLRNIQDNLSDDEPRYSAMFKLRVIRDMVNANLERKPAALSPSPACSECGGSREVKDYRWDEDTELSRYCGMKPCPRCQPSPAEGGEGEACCQCNGSGATWPDSNGGICATCEGSGKTPAPREEPT